MAAREEQRERTDNSVGSVGLSEEALHLVAGYSAVAGLCPLIPVPFVDDVIIEHVHRRLYRRLCAQHDFYLADRGAKILTSRKSELLSGALKSLVLWPIKKILRKVIYVLAIKSCADVAAATFHEGWLLARALEQRYVSLEALASGDETELRRLRDGIVKARDEVDPSATQQTMRSALGLSREVVAPILQSLQGVFSRADDEEARLDAAELEAAPITERIEAEIREHWILQEQLDDALRRALHQRDGSPTPVANAG